MTTAPTPTPTLLDRLPWRRKPEDWDAPLVQDPAVLLWAQGLPVYNCREVWPVDYFTNRATIVRPQFFVLRRGTTDFLVNTEGAEYVRYMLRLPAQQPAV